QLAPGIPVHIAGRLLAPGARCLLIGEGERELQVLTPERDRRLSLSGALETASDVLCARFLAGYAALYRPRDTIKHMPAAARRSAVIALLCEQLSEGHMSPLDCRIPSTRLGSSTHTMCENRSGDEMAVDVRQAWFRSKVAREAHVAWVTA